MKIRACGRALVLAACVAAGGFLRAENESTVLWWMFNETFEIQEVNGTETTTIDALKGRGAAAGKGVNGIRIGAYHGDTLLGYLDVADPDGVVSSTVYTMPTEDYDSGSAEWNAGPTYAIYAPYATDPSVTFMIELGNWNETDNTWLILAHSETGTVESLREFIDVADFEMHGTLEWTGGSYSVPEPTSGILLLVGGALLALRRRRLG